MSIRYLWKKSISIRLATSIGAIFVLMLLISSITYFLLINLDNIYVELIHEYEKEIQPVSLVGIRIAGADNSINRALISNDTEICHEEFVKAAAIVDREFDKLKLSEFKDKRERDLILEAKKEWKKGRDIGMEVLDHNSDPSSAESVKELARVDYHLAKSRARLWSAQDIAVSEIEEKLTTAHVWQERGPRTITALLFFGLVIAGGTGTATIRSITKPIRVLEEGAGRVSDGDFSFRVDMPFDDQIGEVGRIFNKTANQLEDSKIKLQRMATIDSFTGLLNRGEFERLLEVGLNAASKQGQPISLIMLDLDHFKIVNDKYGHQAGDTVLLEVVKCVENITRLSDVVARYGGEEFVVLLPHASKESAEILAERIRSDLGSKEISIDANQAIKITASFGVASFPQDAKQPDDLIKKADKALYTAKEHGRNRVICS